MWPKEIITVVLGTGLRRGELLNLQWRDVNLEASRLYIRKVKLTDREGLHFHSLRHTTASWLTMESIPKQVIARVLGHATTRMTERYSHLAPDAVEEGMREVFED